MRIYDRDLTGAATAGSGRSQEAQKADREGGSATTGSSSGSSDSVEFSSSLASVARALGSLSSDLSNKVQQLASQFQSGTYQPDSLATSQGLVAEALSGGGK
jgi:anti-sigma28 factor (negative regulator of flagellin synthesis)